ncbi:hypothetical protein [Magnetofaba australis]|uniref:Cytochrome c n=1 Tax=Magnetofaba australis IT-1 TaxID=1434232 RepID=A0A1Y2K1Z2_9PROT|nr:hypothetical protein [Magnetofaba australis]OSM02061.1 hypothetical protein MAIT1_02146 [Magnetofaba australis IT-1]
MNHTLRSAVLGMVLILASGNADAAEDARELVAMPPMMQQHMLGNMRDHLAALDEILAALAAGDNGRAAEIAEHRLGMSSLQAHGAAHMARVMPEGMRAAGESMHHAASRFAIAAQNAEMESAERAAPLLFESLQAITAACNACHSSYRIR